MTLREAIEKGFFDLDEHIQILEWNPDEPVEPGEPEEHAANLEMQVGDRFEFWRSMQCKRLRKYVVTKAHDEAGIDDYEVEEVKPDGADPAKPVVVSSASSA